MLHALTYGQNINHSSGSASACSGTYKDSGANGNYSNNENSVMTISASNNNCIQVSFTQFNLEDGFDFLTIYDGTSTNGLLIGTYTGTNSPGTIKSTTGSLTFEFKSDISVTSSGWQANISCSSCASCLPNITDGCTEYVCKSKFYDPGGPGGGYSSKTDVVQTICSSVGNCVQVTFNSVDIVSFDDYLWVYDGPTIAGNLVATVTNGNNYPNTITSTSGCLTFRFFADKNAQAGGWDADITCVDCGACTADSLISNCTSLDVCSGLFYDPAGPGGKYGNNLNEIQTVCAPSGQCLEVDFASFDLENGNDTLYIYDGTSIGHTLIGAYTWFQGPTSIESTSGCLTFQFVTNSSGQFDGWEAEFACKPCSHCPPKISNCSDTTCNSGFYDTGGIVNDYGNNESFIRTACADSGKCMQVVFDVFDLENGFDFLTIYDGNSINAPVIGVFTGTNSPDSIVSTSGCLTFKFDSDATFSSAGWEARLECQTCPSCLPNMSNCTDTICAGVFYDDGGKYGDYSNQQSLVHTIYGENGKCPRVDFSAFDLNTSGTGDKLNIYDGPNTSSTFLGQFTGTNNPGVVIGTSGSITFWFQSSTIGTAPGWEASVSCVSCNACPANMTTCSDSVCTGKFYDSGGANGDYGSGEYLVRTICSDNGQCVQLDFTSFELEQGFDVLKVYDGPSVNATLLGIYSGTSSPGTVVGSGGCLTFEFQSDGSFQFDGWEADISCTNCQTCLPKMSNCTDTVCGGKFYDPGGNLINYQNNENLIHTVCGPAGQCFEVDFTAFSLDTLDSLWVFDGPDTSGTFLGAFTDTIGPGNIQSASGCITFLFISDGSNVSDGWEADLTCNQCPSCLPTMGTCYDNACSGDFWDTGTDTSNYAAGEDLVHTICSNSGTCLEVDFTKFRLGDDDTLWIYDGTSQLDPFIGYYTDSVGPGAVTAQSGCLTFRFISDSDTATLDSGWEASINCVACPKCPEKMTQCIDTICSANFYDPGGNNINYQNNQHIFRTYCSDNGQCIRVDFDSFELEFGWDFLTIYDGSNANAPVIGTFTGTNSPGNITASGGCITFEFFSDGSNTKPGWEAEISCEQCFSCLPNMANCADTTCMGNFYDSGGDTTAYGNNDTLITTVCSPFGNCITMEFDSFAVDTTDTLCIYAGADTSGVLIGKYTGTNSPGWIYSDSSCLTFYFVSDSADTADGWQANIDCQTCFSCEPAMSNCNDSICVGDFYDSGGDTSGYQPGELLVRTYCADDGSCISVSFDTLDLEDGFDFLYVYDGSDSLGYLIGAFTGNVNPGTVTSSTGCLTFVFKSDQNISLSGWEASLSCSPCNVCLPKMGTCSDTTCGGFFYDSGLQAFNYEDDDYLVHTICSDDSNCVEVKFLSFDVHESDTLHVYEGVGINGTLIGSYTDTIVPGTVFGGSSCLTFEFISDNSESDSGWVAEISCRTCVKCPEAMTTCADTTCDGNFFDSGGINGQYSNNDTLVRTICGEAGKCIKVEFNSFDLEDGFDLLRIYDGADMTGNYLGQYTGTSSPGAVVSQSGCLTFEFVSDNAITKDGWEATIECVSCPATCLPKMTDCTDTICNGDFYDSGGLDYSYNNDDTLTTTICSPFGKCLQIVFESFDVDSTDTLFVYAGPNTGSTLIGAYTDTIVPDTFNSINGCLTFHFVSDSADTAAGWDAKVTCADCPPCLPNIGFCVDTTCSSDFRDSDAGASNYYNNNEYFVHTVCSDAGQCMQVDFSSLSLGTGDTLRVFDGSSTNGVLLEKISGQFGPVIISSTLGCLTFEFESNGFGTDSGWVADIICVPCPACPAKMTNCTDTTCGGKFYDSGGLTQGYQSNENLVKTICGGAGECVTVDFTSIDLEQNFDYIRVYDGSSTQDQLIGTVTGIIPPSPFTSTAGCLTFEFVSDGSTTGDGWEADVICTPCTNCLPILTDSCVDSLCQSKFYDVGGPDEFYEHADTIVHTVCSPIGKCMEVDFSSFDVLQGDSLYVYDGSDTSATLLGVYSGTTSPTIITSSQGCLTFLFVSDTSGAADGWSADINCVECPSCLHLMGNCTDSTCSGKFYDPAGISGNYADNEYIVHTICSDKGECLGIDFKTFDLDNSDVLNVYDGPNISFPSLGSYTGTDTNGFYISSASGCLTFELITDGSGNAAGWVADINCISCGNCPAKMTACTDTLCSGKFYDPGGNEDYGNYENVIKTICGPNGACPVVTFNSFAVQNTNDILFIADGPTTFGDPIGTYTGNNNPGTVIGTSGCLTFHFQSNGSGVAAGWDADISCESCEISCLPIMADGCIDSVCSGDFYDSGDNNGTYSNNESFIHTICGLNGDCIGADFTDFEVENFWDRLYIYDGPDTTYPVIPSPTPNVDFYTDTVSPDSVQSTYGCLTFYFESDNSGVFDGWEADLFCEPCATCLPELDNCTDTVCNSEFFDDGGLLYDYHANRDITHTVCADSGSCIQVSFDKFDVDSSDVLYVYDGPSVNYPLIGAFNSANPIDTITATVGCLTFRFVSDSVFEADGWEGNFTCVPCPPCLPIMNNCMVDACDGMFFDAGGKNDDYANDQVFEHTICSDSGNCSRVDFSSFNLSVGDTLWIYDGATADTSSSLIGVFHKDTTPDIIISHSGCLTFYFESDSVGVADGWEAKVLCGDCNCLPNMMNCTDSVCSGNFYDHGGDTTNYGNNETFLHTICSDSGYGSCAQVIFSSFSLGAGDTLFVYNGADTNALLIDAYTQSNIPDTLTSFFGCLTFHFVSDSVGTDAGWTSDIVCIPCPPCLPVMVNCVDSVCTGNFFDPGGNTANYGDNLHFIHTICSDDGSCTRAFFSTFDVDSSDVLNVYDGADTTGILLGVYTGKDSIGELFSLSGCLTFEFISDSSVNDTGWLANVYCAPCVCLPVMANCHDSICFSNFMDPGGFAQNYFNNDTLEHIVCSDSGNCMRIDFTSFAIDSTDTLYIYDGSDSTATLIGKYNGTTLPFNIYSLSGCLKFVLVTDSVGNAAGWTGNLYCAPCLCLPVMNACSDSVCSGDFYDPGGYSGAYFNNDTLIHEVCADDGNCVKMQFQGFEVDVTDTLFIYDGPINPANLIGAYTGTNSPGFINSTSGCLTFMFVTDSANVGPGWAAEIQCGPCICLPYMANCIDTTCVDPFWDSGGDLYNYSNNDTLTHVVCPTAGTCSQVVFSEFAVDSTDTLYIYVGTSANGPLLGKFTAGNIPDTLTSLNGCLTFVFISDSTITDSGWVAQLSCVPCPICAPTISNCLDSICSGDFWDSGGPVGNYSNDEFFLHTICSDSGNCVRLTFSYMDLDSADTLWIFDGTNEFAPLVGMYTDSMNPGEIFSLNGCFTIKFVTDSVGTATGWEAKLSCAECACLPMINNCMDFTCNNTFWDTGRDTANYSNDEYFVHSICSDEAGSCVRIDFTEFRLDSADTMFIWDGTPGNSPTLIGAFVDSLVPFNVFSLSGCLTFEFTADSVGADSGWFGNIYCAPCVCLPVMNNCQDTICSGNFYDPGGISGEYSNNDTLIHTICGDSGTCVTVSFTSFDLDSSDALCVYEGSDTTGQLVGIFTGGAVPLPITSSSGCLTFLLITDSANTDTGWTANISCGPCICLPYMSNCADTTCNHVFTDPGGFLQDYGNSSTVTHTVCSDSLGCLQVDFTEFKLQNGNDYLRIFDGPDNTYPQLAVMTGSNGLTTIESSSGCVTFELASDGSITDSGWVANIKCVGCPTCGTAMTTCVDSTCGTQFYDPGGLNGEYEVHDRKIKTFCPDSAGMCMKALFSSFDLGSGDSLYVYDGDSTTGSIIGVFYDGLSPDTLVSLGGCFTFEFVSDSVDADTGWAAGIWCTKCTNCIPIMTDSCVDSICSGNFYDSGGSGNNYANSDLMTHTICSPYAGSCMEFNFSSFKTQVNVDKLKIFDGPDINSPQIANLSGTLSPFTVKSTTGCLTFQFNSSTFTNDEGWESSFTCVPCSNSAPCLPNIGNCLDSTCSSNFYDPGGASNNYPDNQFVTHTVCGVNGKCTYAAFNYFQLEGGGFDYLKIFDGPDINSPLIGTYTGTNSPGNVQSFSGCLTFQFKSDGSTNLAGWDANLTCVNCPKPCGFINTGFVWADTGLNVTFVDTGYYVPPATFKWLFGDGDSSTVQNPTHGYSAPGVYNACLIVTDSCVESDTTCDSVVVTCPGSTIDFGVDSSSYTTAWLIDSTIPFGTIKSWLWDFGDGTTDTVPNPIHYFPHDGPWTVCLTIQDSCSTDSACKTIQLDCPSAVADWDYTDTLVTFWFSDSSTSTQGGIDSLLWDFGDGNSDTAKNPVHIYAQGGNYTVCLSVWDSCGIDSMCKVVFVDCPLPYIDWSYTDTLLTVNFSDSISGTGTLSWYWDFGDGDTTTTLNPTHDYDSSGSYIACLIVTDSCWTDSLCDTVTVLCPPPTVGFTHSTTFLHATFTDTSSGIGTLNWYWDFGDGGTDTTQNSAHTYASAGTYQVCLIVVDSCQSDTACDSINIVCPDPSVGFQWSATNLSVSFNDTTSGNGGLSWSWTFGDGNVDSVQHPTHLYPNPGTYTACLTVTDTCNTAQACSTITVTCPGLTSDFGWSDTLLTVQFSDSSAGSINSWKWYFGDGDSSAVQNPTHDYAASGTYTVCLYATDACGTDSTCKSVTVLCPKPSVNFGWSSSFLTAVLTDSSTGIGTLSYLWDFGDGNTSTNQNPVHFYPGPGDYTVCLTVTDSCDQDSMCQIVKVVCNIPTPGFTNSNNLWTVTFNNTSVIFPPATFEWDFGDGSTSNVPNPTYTYSANGNYTVCLKVTDTCGTDTLCKVIQVICPKPVAGFSFVDTLQTATFTDTSSGTGTMTYFWEFGDGGTSTQPNPTYTWATEGIYTVCLTVTDTCSSDSVCKTVSAICPDPQTGFAYSDTLLTVNFTDTTPVIGNATYFWDFGDGNVSTLQNPTYTYASQGTYQVCLSVTDTCGTDSSCQNVTLTCPLPFFDFAIWDTVLTVTYQTLIIPNGSEQYFWDFGDGGTSTQKDPKYTYNAAGTYTVCLTVSDTCGSDSVCNIVTVTCPPPVADFGFSDTLLTVNFFDSSAVTFTPSILWNFGDGGNSIANNPTHDYAASGTYTVCLTIIDTCGQDSVCKNVTVLCPIPSVAWSDSTENNDVWFTSTLSTTGSYSVLWTFGDGDSATTENPMHSYPGPGVYQVCLYVSDSCGADTVCNNLNISCPLPTAGFTYTDTLLQVSFTDTSSGNGGLAYSWDFGDGMTSTAQNPIHNYAASGTYQVCLVVLDTCTTDTLCDSVTVLCPAPTADFDAVASNVTVVFSDSSTGTGALSWAWDFGDGNTSNAQNPTHQYSIAGTYTVCQTVTDTCGSDSTCQSVTVSCPGLTADFGYSDTLLTVNFSDSSSGSGLTYLWTFGDGDSSTVQNPTHDYATSGSYTACLKITDVCGSDTACQTITVLCPKPTVAFTVSDSLLTATFTNTTTIIGSATYLWDFGDGDNSSAKDPVHDYATSGTYTVCLTVTDSCDQDSSCMSVTVLCPDPIAGFTESATQLSVNFTDTSSGTGSLTWLWDFGDGNTSIAQNPSHTYSQPDTYTVCLTVIDSCAQDSACKSLVISCPAPSVTWTDSTSLLTAFFTDQTTTQGSPSWAWDFGDGNTSVSQNPVHVYSGGGNYTVCLTITDLCGTDSICQTVTINCPLPSVAFTFADSLTYYDFTDASSGTGTLSQVWTFGDGNSSVLQNPSHQFAQNGKYNVCLTITDTCGTDSSCQTITINCPTPTSDFTFTGSTLTYTFTNTSTINTPAAWQWNFGDGNTSASQNPTHSYSSGGNYTVCLIANDLCNSDTTCKTVNVVCPDPTASFTYSDSLVFVDFTDGSTTNGSVTYTWDFGDGNNSNAQNPSHAYSSGGNFTVCLIVDDECSSDTVCNVIAVGCPDPVGGFTFADTLLTVAFTDTSSGVSLSGWDWTFGDGASSNQQNPTHNYATSGTYNVCLIVTGTCGKDTICDSVTAICPQPVAEFAYSSINLTYTFSDSSLSASPLSWLWDFGDGNQATDSSTTHTYATPGTYVVCMSTADLCGSDSICKTIAVTCSPPSVNFGHIDTLLTVNFSDSSTSFTGNETYSWNFGDGNTSGLKDPIHTYSAAGTYTVCHYVTDICGTDSLCKVISLTCPLPQVTWTSLSNNLSANFTNTTNSNDPTSYLWHFGDGGISTSENPTHLYSVSGTYTVCLTVTDLCGTDSTCKNVIIACPPIAPAFGVSTSLLTATFTDSSSGFGSISYQWTFGDGGNSFVPNPVYTYASAGTYLVCLSIIDSCNTDSTCKFVTVTCPKPQAGFIDSTSLLTLYLTDTSVVTGSNNLYQWDFGDGSISNLQNPTHIYTIPDTYVVCLTLTDTCSKDTICDSIVIVCPKPVATWEGTVNNLSVTFIDSSVTSGNATYSWDFGDNNTSSQPSPIHTYSGYGKYQVCLIIEDGCGKDTLCKEVDVKCADPDPKFGWSNNNLVVTFSDSSTGAGITQWQWDFGDGNGSLAQNPMYTYTTPATYWVCLTVTDTCGDSTYCDSVKAENTISVSAGVPDEQVIVFPNPTRGELYIKFRMRKQQEAYVVIRNVLGQMVRRQELGMVEYSVVKVDMSDIAGGIYHLEINIEGKTVIKKVDLMR